MGKKTNAKSRPAARKARNRHGRRTSPGQHDHLAVFDSVCRDFVVAGGKAVLASGDPLQAEGWASHVLGVFSELPLIGEADTVAAIGARLVSVASRRRSLDGQVCLRALAAVAPGPLGARAARAATAGARHIKEPSWFGAIGAARPTGAWRASDIWGDQDSIMVGFAYPGGAEHTLLVLIDHPLGGIVKDAAVLESPLAAVIGVWDDDEPAIMVVSEPVDVAAERVIEAMVRTERAVNAPVTDDYPDTTALLRARFAPLAASVPSEEPPDSEGRGNLVRAFLASPEGGAYADDPHAWFLLDALVDYGCDQHEGDPLCWSGGAAERFLLDWVPRKLSAPDSTLRRAPDVLRAWVSWAARSAGLAPEVAEESLQVIDST